MPGLVTGTIGQEEVKLNNAATESTLALLVSSMEKIAKGLGVKGKDYDKELKNLKTKSDLDEKNNKITKEVNVERDKENKSLKSGRAVLDSFSAGIGLTIGKISRFSDTLGGIVNAAFSNTVPTVESFASKIPIVGGLFGALGRALDQNVSAFRTLSSAGIDMGKGIFAAQNAAARAGLSLTEFTEMTKNSSQTLAKFGGTAGQGAQVFTGMMAGMKKSGFSETAGKLGITMQELGENTLSYMELQSRSGRAGSMSQEQLQQGAEKYNMELDKLSRATGISRKSIDEQNQALARDAKMKLATSKLSEEERVALAAQIKQLEAMDPTGKLAAGFKDMIATGGVAVTKEAKAYQLAMQSAGQDASKLTRDINNGVKGSVAASDQAFVAVGKKANEMTDAQRKQGATMGALGKDSVHLAQASLQGYKSVSDGAKAAAVEQKKAEEDKAKAAANVDRQLLSMVQSLQSLILSTGIMDVMLKVVSFTMKMLGEGIKYVTNFMSWAKGKSFEEIVAKVLDDLGIALSKAGTFIWDKVVPALIKAAGVLWEKVVPAMIDAAGKIWDKVAPVLSNAAIAGVKFLFENPKVLAALAAGVTLFFAAAVAKAAAARAVSNVKESIVSKIAGPAPGAAAPAAKGAPAASAVGKGAASAGAGVGKGAAALGEGAGKGLSGLLQGLGKGIEMVLKGIAAGASMFANPKVAAGIAVVTLSVLGLSAAFKIASPGFEAFGKMVETILNSLDPVIKSFGEIFSSVINGITTVMSNIAPIVESFGAAFKDVLNGIATVISSVGESIKGIISSIAEGIGNVIGKITEFKTAGVTATTEQIERLSAIPADKMVAAAAGIEAMKKALDGFGPGLLGSIGGALSGLIGGDQAEKLNKLADAGVRLEPVGRYLAAITENVKAFESVKFENIEIGSNRFKELSTHVSSAANAFKQLEPSMFDKVGEKINSLTASFKEVGKSIAASVTGVKDAGKSSQDKVLSDLNTKLDQLNTSMTTLVEIQTEMLGPTKKTAKNTKATSGRV